MKKNRLLEEAMLHEPEKVRHSLEIEREAAEMAKKAIEQFDSLSMDAWGDLSPRDKRHTDVLEFTASNFEKVLGGKDDLFMYMKAVLIVHKIMESRLERIAGLTTPRTVKGLMIGRRKREKAELAHEMMLNTAIMFTLWQIKRDIMERYEVGNE
jgi:hypothetical protein